MINPIRTENVNVDFQGSEISINFNAKYILDVLNIIKNGKVKFHFSEKTAPTILQSDSLNNALFFDYANESIIFYGLNLRIEKLTLNNFRNHKYLKLEITKNMVLIYGENGSGKTSVLESISLFDSETDLRHQTLANLSTMNSGTYIEMFGR